MASNALRFLDAEGVSAPTPIDPLCVLDKERSVKQYVNYMLDRTNRMFEYDGLPDTIPAYMLELYLQIFGYAAFLNVDTGRPILYPQELPAPKGLHIFFGGIGGERDIYYRPRTFIAANPRLTGSVNCTILYDNESSEGIEKPCVIMKNDANYCGLLPLFNRYAAQLMENDISIRSAQINARALTAIEALSERDKEGARKYLDDLEAGKLGVIAGAAFLDGIRTSNVSTQSSNTVIQLIELQQYLKASWYNELGLNVNFNMKREYMSEEEIAVNTDILLPLVDDMLECRVKACELINKTFGTDIKVCKSSAWANKEQEELSALSEAAAAGGIGLKDTIAEKIEGDEFSEDESSVDKTEQVSEAGEVPEEIRDEVHEDSERPEGSGDRGDGSERMVRSEVEGDEPQISPDVTVQVSVEVKGGDLSEPDSNESETPEKSEEPDAE